TASCPRRRSSPWRRWSPPWPSASGGPRERPRPDRSVPPLPPHGLSVARVVVIGGGITGLVAAHRLRAAAPDREVLLLEGSERCGGHVGSVHEGGFVVEAGPNGFLARANEPETLALVRELNLEGSLIAARETSKRRYV